MKAAVLCAPGELEIREIDDALCPKGGALIRVEACAVCPSDIKMLREGHRDLSYPRTLGHEVVGELIEVDTIEAPPIGSRIQIWPGIVCNECPSCLTGIDNICTQQGIFGFNYDGGFAEYMAIPPGSIQRGLNVVSGSIDANTASLTEPLACCVHAHNMCQTSESEYVLIIGAGPMGLLHTMLTLSIDARPIVVEPIEERRRLAEQLGAYVLDPSENLSKDVLKLTGRGADIAMLATPLADISEVMRSMAPRGRVCVFSGLPLDDGIKPINLRHLHYNELTLVGAYGCTSHSNKQALELISSETIDVGRLITMKTDLEHLEDGFLHVEKREGLKCIITEF
ncbi:MAG: alcohol dehydrogenase catalytic domain-containing protein [Euryarchaeota archaeon]|nr:alcohol dehydrogenase catalytic domain-containing protein [Euryarchaeota archaeon]